MKFSAANNLSINAIKRSAAVCMLFAGILLTGAFQSHAQEAKKPLDLGTVVEKSAPKPTYLKLPQTVPVPSGKPAAPAQSAEGAATDAASTAAPGQIAPAGAQAGQAATEPAAEQPEEQQAEPVRAPDPEIQEGGIAQLQLVAYLKQEDQILQRGINWRIYEEKRDANGRLPLLQNETGGPLNIELAPGRYIVYAGYGFANLTKRLVLPKAGSYSEAFVLQAGGIKLNAVAAGDVPLDDNILTFDIFTRGDGNGGGQELIAKNVKPEHVVKLTEGTYHIVSSYGTSNAKVRGDVEVEAGKLVSVTMIHHAAKVTLRLVSEPGGEALTNTVWTVLTPGGDVVKRAIGAFPTLALAAGDYTAVAKQNEEVYNRDFSVDSGLDRDIEVLASLR